MSKTVDAIHCLLHPKSIAILGASGDFSRFTGRTLKYLLKHGYPGKIFPINPKYGELCDLKCYPSLHTIPEPVETVFIQIPGAGVVDAVKECIDHGVKTAIIHTAGMGESGPEGRNRQEAVKRLAWEKGLRICGPNSAGIVNIHGKVALTPVVALELDSLTPGSIGLVSQSGGMTGAFLTRAEGRKIGFSSIISTGNEMDLEAADYLEYFLEDSRTKVIAVFLEQFRNIPKFLRVADLAREKRKPIVILKIGRTEIGAKAAASHTGALTGSDAVYDAVFKQKGITRVYAQEDLIEVASLFSRSRPPRGKRVGIVTTTGGGAMHLADECAYLGMEFPSPSPETLTEASKGLPAFASVGNPLDVTMSGVGGGYRQSLDLFLKDENFDLVVAVVGTSSQFAPEMGVKPILDRDRSSPKPLVSFLNPDAQEALRLLEENGIATFRTPEGCARALKHFIELGRSQDQFELRRGRSPLKFPLKAEGLGPLLSGKKGARDERESKALLAAYGVPTVREAAAKNAEEAASMAARIGFPVVLKILSPQILHKTEAGAVRLNLCSPGDVRAAFHEAMKNAKAYNPQAEIQGVLIQEMLGGGTEVIVGTKRDSQFGPVILFGLGGVFVELFRDVALRVAPILKEEAQEMVEEVKGYRLLQGFRGKPRGDIEALVDVLCRVSQLAVDLKDRLVELDVNPLMVFEKGKGVRAADALAVLE
jgi:acyl-CoA synthetase (NDP forming)